MSSRVTLHDYKPKWLSFHDAVVAGLSAERKSIPSKFFYDQRGSALFEQICQQPEYYPPRVEMEMLEDVRHEIAELSGEIGSLIEPGAGSALKVRLLLDEIRPLAYVPQDISFTHLEEAANNLAADYPWLSVHAICIDFTHSIAIPDIAPAGRRLVFFPGSSIGNFTPEEAETFLAMVRRHLGPNGLLLIGVDTKKDQRTLNEAYNDSAGVTAAFNLNLVHRMRDELGMDCDPDNFEHLAFYNDEEGRIEMHLVSRCQQVLHLNGYRFPVAEGEKVHTENSYKYAPETFISLAEKTGFRERSHWLGKDGLFALYLFEA